MVRADQYEHTLQCTGRHDPDDALHWRRDGVAFYVRDDRVTAVVTVDAGRSFRRALALVDQPADLSLLLDDALDLRTLRPALTADR